MANWMPIWPGEALYMLKLGGALFSSVQREKERKHAHELRLPDARRREQRGCFLLSSETLMRQLALVAARGWEGGGGFCKTSVEYLAGACREGGWAGL
jgi:hypothetical protein